MEKIISFEEDKTFQILTKYNQQHLFEYYIKIENKEQKNKFLNQIKHTDFELLNTLYKYHISVSNSNDPKNSNFSKDYSPIESSFTKSEIGETIQKELFNLGLEKVNQGKIGLLILAGGQGSRLGFNKAKGIYQFGMPSNKSLFQYLCERFISIQNLSKSLISEEKFKPSFLLIMTSIENNSETVEFFKEKNYFGINSNQIIFFSQETIASLDLDGKVINKEADEIFQAPNGNGGCFIALKKNKVIERCMQEGIEFIHVLSIDNPMSKPLDPFYVGLTYKEGKARDLQMSAKCVPKREPSEPIGVFINIDGKPLMVDYGDVPKELTEMRNEKSQLVYRGGNILNYLISTKLLNNVLLDESKYKDLINEFHISRKKIPCVNLEKGNIVSSVKNGIKFELFFNSIFKFAEKDGLLLLEIERKEEFSPIKNPEDSVNDNPRTARKMMTELFVNWYLNSGGTIINEKNLEFNFEISYMLSYDGENLNHSGSNIIPLKVEITEENINVYLTY